MDSGERRARDLANENYRYFPNVCGVGFGSKFTDGARLENVRSIQFFVTGKIAPEELTRPLPRFVYARRADGTLDRDRKIPTDVVDIGALELCCAAGDKIERVNGGGTTTLIFRNKTADGRLLLLTCSHVVGDLSISPQQGPLVGGTADCIFQATILANTVLTQGHLEFDVALAEIISHDPTLTELAVTGTATKLDGFADDAALAIASEVSCISPVSGNRSIVVDSAKTDFRGIDAGGGVQISIGNLIACKGDAVKGDSGGIVFVGTKAVGMLVARGTNGWVLIHPLQNAILHLASAAGIPLACFA